MGGKNWTIQEKQYLEDNWGMVSTKYIAKKLNRSVKALKNQANRMSLGDVCDNTDGIPLKDIAYLVGKEPNDIYRTWVGRHNLKTTKIHYCLKVVTDKELARFMQKHPNLWTPSECDSVYFGEYDWFNEALEKEHNTKMKRSRAKWNQADTEMVGTLRRRGYTYQQIGEQLNRTASACRYRWLKYYGKFQSNTCNK